MNAEKWEERALKNKGATAIGVTCRECLKPISPIATDNEDNCQCGDVVPMEEVVRAHGLDSLSGFKVKKDHSWDMRETVRL